jgi:tRNA pseudouridine55 synthase
MSHQWSFEEGEILLFDKPFDWSSFDLVQKVKNLIKKYTGKKVKVGHAGTLDPYATGLLIICTGKFTKRIESIQDQTKTYSGLIKLGATTASYDLESEPDTFFPTGHITDELIFDTVKGFIGKHNQLPPIFSAKMINGQRAYELARKGEVPVMNPKKIEIFDFAVNRISHDELEFSVKCTKGTYIRSLAHDLGKALDSGAYLASLRRDAIGDHQLTGALSIEDFRQSLESL